MARPRKVSLSERIKQKRLSSRAPSSQDHGAPAPEALHVAPLPPLPAIEPPVVAKVPAPAPVVVEVAEPVVASVPEPAVASAPEPVTLRRAAEPAPPPPVELDDEARLELERSIDAVPSLAKPRYGIAVVAGLAVMFGVAIGIKITRMRAHRPQPPVALV